MTGSGSWNFGARTRQDQLRIIGSNGEIVFSVFEDAPVKLTTAADSQTYDIENPENIQLYHVQEMRDTLLGNKAHRSNGVAASHTAWVMGNILDML